MLGLNEEELFRVFFCSLFLGIPLAALFSLLFLQKYRRAVLKSMRSRAPAAVVQEKETAPRGAHAEPPPLDELRIEELGGKTPLELSAEAAALYRRVLRGPHQTAAAYVLAGLAYALVAAAMMLLEAGVPLMLGNILVAVFLTLTWPVLQTAVPVATTGRHVWRFAIPWVLLWFPIILLVTSPREWGAAGGSVVAVSMVATVFSFLCLILVTTRTIRSVAPLVLLVVSVALGAAYLGHHFARQGAAAGVAGLGAGLLLLRWVARRYEKKKTSDQMVAARALWLLILLISIALSSSSPKKPLSLLLVAGVAYEVVFRWRLGRLRKASRKHAPTRLLLLRVFGSRRRSEELLDHLNLHWRHVGSIQLIAGADLATQNLEPHEFLSFVSGRLARRFVAGRADVAWRVAEMDQEPDPDGRFRVNEFFCHEDTWRITLQALVCESDAVLMDLRGFSRQNEGCSYELGQLVDLVPVERVVLTVDATSNVEFLREELAGAWRTTKPDSPNRDGTAGPLRILRIDGKMKRSAKQLLRLLCAAADAGRRAGASPAVTAAPAPASPSAVP